MRLTKKTIEVRCVYRDEDKNIQGGVNFYWVVGAKTVLYQEWEHSCAGKIWEGVAPDPMAQDGLLDYFLECWQGRREDGYLYEVESVDEDYR
jgi:hypothetical protein